MSYELGDDGVTARNVAPRTLAEWRLQVIARKHTPVRMPKGPSRGELAERYKDSRNVFRYALAPANIRAIDRREQLSDNVAIAEGKIASIATGALSVPAVIGESLTSAPRKVIGSVLGIPPGMVTVLAIGIGAVVLPRLLDNFLPSRR